MKAVLNSLRRFSLTGLVVLVALWAGYKLWDYYMDEPWTRDGHVRADVVPVAPDVSGFVTEVLVSDNQQVRRGDVLFRIDRARYDIALRQAEAVLLGKRAQLDEANADLERYSALTPGVVVSKQRMDQVVATQGTAQAAYDQGVADLRLAKLNLERSDVRAAVNGVVTDLSHAGQGRDGPARFGYAACRGLLRGNQAAAHPCRRCCQCAAAGQRSHAARKSGKRRGGYRR
jgi:multidrug resistance efflux pump